MSIAPWKESCNQPRQHLKKQRHYFANKGLSGQSYSFSNIRVSNVENCFNPELIHRCEFRGMIVIGKLRCATLKYHDLEHIQKQRHYFANKGLSSQGYGFSCGL